MTLIEIEAIALELEDSLLSLDLSNISMSDSGKSYFQFNLGKIKFNNRTNAFILNSIFEKLSTKELKNICIIDHGAGIGFFGLLAKKCGVGKIVCHDLSKDMIQDCKVLSNYLNLGFDYYVLGDTLELITFCKAQNIEVSALASRNVIEHVGDLPDFFHQLYNLPGKELVLMITTSANMHNPLVHLQHKRIHRHYEYQGSYVDMMKSSLDHENSGRNIRKRIIKDLIPTVNEMQLEQLITNSRGLNLQQIKLFVNQYLNDSKVPDLKEKLTNTMDPHFGVWVEHLVPFDEYKKMALGNGFDTESLAGFYNVYYKSMIARNAAIILNVFIRIFPFWHRILSPFLAMRFIRRS